MWFVIAALAVSSTYNLIYSIVLCTSANPQCELFTSELANGFLTTFSRLIQYVFWLLPVICIFWPAGSTSSPFFRVCNFMCCFKYKPITVVGEGNDDFDDIQDDDRNGSIGNYHDY